MHVAFLALGHRSMHSLVSHEFAPVATAVQTNLWYRTSRTFALSVCHRRRHVKGSKNRSF
jgi:hypothetical protein